MSQINSFRDLIVYQKAYDVSKEIFEINKWSIELSLPLWWDGILMNQFKTVQAVPAQSVSFQSISIGETSRPGSKIVTTGALWNQS